MGSFHELRTRAHCPMNRALRVGRALRRPPPKPCCEKFPQIRSVYGEVVRMAGALRRARPTFRFMESFHELRTRAHCPMNRALRVGRALRRPPPKRCCEEFPQIRSVYGEVVRTGGAQRSARPTFRFMESATRS